MSSNRLSYPSDHSEAQWQLLELLIPVDKSYGRPREYDLRAIVNGIFYVGTYAEVIAKGGFMSCLQR
jgi:transposase